MFATQPAHVRATDKGFTELVEGTSPKSQIGVTVKKVERIKRRMDG